MGINGFHDTGHWIEHSVQKLPHHLLMFWASEGAEFKIEGNTGFTCMWGFQYKSQQPAQEEYMHSCGNCQCKTDFKLNLGMVLKSFAYRDIWLPPWEVLLSKMAAPLRGVREVLILHPETLPSKQQWHKEKKVGICQSGSFLGWHGWHLPLLWKNWIAFWNTLFILLSFLKKGLVVSWSKMKRSVWCFSLKHFLLMVGITSISSSGSSLRCLVEDTLEAKAALENWLVAYIKALNSSRLSVASSEVRKRDL